MDKMNPSEDGGPSEDDDAPAPPPAAFGMAAQPFGCGVAGGVLFALAVTPVVLLYAAPNPCFNYPSNCQWPPEGTRFGLALVVWAGAAFGLATGAMVARRLALWREGRSVRPALWVAFVALFAIAWGPGSVLLSLLLAVIDGAAG
jgi:hypothetical protein